jgi:hypothetical protein
MRILIPYTSRHTLTLAGAPKDATWRYVGDDNQHYWRVMCEEWGRDDLWVLEHDVIPHDTVRSEFESCPMPWCAYGYDDICHPECMDAWDNVLGCTRFSKELQEAVPDAVTNASIKDWHNLCDGIGRNLRKAGHTQHWHTPPVLHHHMALDRLAII